jgi:hypothetical protein
VSSAAEVISQSLSPSQSVPSQGAPIGAPLSLTVNMLSSHTAKHAAVLGFVGHNKWYGLPGVLLDRRVTQASGVPQPGPPRGRARRLYFVRPAVLPGRPAEALLFVGDDAQGAKLEVAGVELADGRLRVIHAMPMRPGYEPLYQEALTWRQ